MTRNMKKIRNRTLTLFKNISSILAPPPVLTISEWADNYRMLSSEASAEAGRWRTDRAPYQRGMMDAISDNSVETVVIKSSAQVGKSEILLNTIGYYIDYDPSPILLLQPTVDGAKDFSKDRIATMVRDTPAITEKVSDSKAKDSNNTILHKIFPGGHLTLVGANSPAGLASRPIRVLLADEVDRYPVSAGSEGDPLALAEKRTKTFWNKKKVYVSTPTERGVSRIEFEFEDSTQEEWCLPCPCCGRYQPLVWAQIKFDDVTMECKFCKERFKEHEWKAQEGKWVVGNPNASESKRGFHINALASPWERWDTIIKEFKIAKKDKEKLKTWVNTTLGESWEDDEGESTDENTLIKRRETYNAELPEDVLVLTAGVDVQDNRLELEVVGWGVDKENWGIEYKTFYGDLGQSAIWNQLDEYLMKDLYFNDGSSLKISCICIDSGGHYTDEVYKFTKGKEHRRIFAIKGYGGDKPFIGKPSRNNRYKVALFPIGVDLGKENIFLRLKTEFEGPGYSHFPTETEKGYDEVYFKGLCSEKRVLTHTKGVSSFKWIKKSGRRNEPLDVRNYANAAYEILNPNVDMLQKLKRKGDYYSQSPIKGTKKVVKKRRMISKGV
ncbi:bacteriophage tail assembly protein [Clostridium cylindrosporum DSM 605]|uniref:Bacteriophage tail assembly protein n=1 Tax=Clostridium cylindrosporum DSM 605 TaxID=1121307 RepID=A0A0J8DAW9_CLOCY|nr:phage terminase large subunit family protein [Clostridium cylindrosporum]KMT22997.1 bacteriophage tail assembly protein [Clostridium cylindrosporum DSM 605]